MQKYCAVRKKKQHDSAKIVHGCVLSFNTAKKAIGVEPSGHAHDHEDEAQLSVS